MSDDVPLLRIKNVPGYRNPDHAAVVRVIDQHRTYLRRMVRFYTPRRGVLNLDERRGMYEAYSAALAHLEKVWAEMRQ